MGPSNPPGTRLHKDSLTGEELAATQQRLEGFERAGVPFPKAWCLTDSKEEGPENWKEIRPLSWQDLQQFILTLKDKDHAMPMLLGLHDLTADLERILEVEPSLWSAFVGGGGQCAFYTGKHTYEASGACHDHRSISYRINSSMMKKEAQDENQPLTSSTLANTYPTNVLAHEIGHMIDMQAKKRRRVEDVPNDEKSEEEEFQKKISHQAETKPDGRFLLMSSPLFQEAFLLDINTRNDDAVATNILSKIKSGGGLTGCENDVHKSARHARAVRTGDRLPGDDRFYRTDKEREDAQKHRIRAGQYGDIRKNSAAIMSDRQKRLPPYNDIMECMHEMTAQEATQWVAHRDMDARSTWLEAFARVCEIYYGTQGLNVKALPYPALSRFMQGCVSPVFETLASDATDEDKTAKLALAERYLNKPLKDMMTYKDYNRYMDLRDAMGSTATFDTAASREAKQILIHTIDRVASEITSMQTQQPRQRTLF